MPPRKKASKPQLYEIDGKHFASPSLCSAYRELTAYQRDGLIDSFALPEGFLPKNKFNSTKCTIDGMVFDSLMEGRYYVQLKLEQKNKIVSSFTCQHVFELQPKFKKGGKTIRPITYVADFYVCYENGVEKAIDVKGRITKEFALKKKMFDFRFPKTELELVQWRAKVQQWIKMN